MKITKASAFLLGFYSVLLIWWFTLYSYGLTDNQFNLVFAFAYGLLPVFGGILGLETAAKWGMTKSVIGKALMFLSLGLISWGIGEMIWSYYNFALHVEVPYPSLADVCFIMAVPLWISGVYYLSKATGTSFGMKHKDGKLLLVGVPIIALIFSYYLLIVVAREGQISAWEGPLKVFFDFTYPVGDLIILAEAALVYGLSFRYLGGRYKWPVLITLFGFLVMYCADFSFSYTTTVKTFYNGNWVDLLFTTAMFIMSFGVNTLTIKD